MNADNKPGAGFTFEDLKSRVLTLPDINSPIQGIQVSQKQVIEGTNITKQYLIADVENPWGYARGVYMVTNLLPAAFAKQKATLGMILGNNALFDLIPAKSGEALRSYIVPLYPTYLAPGGAVIFQIGNSKYPR